MESLRVALCQIDATVGDLAGNLRRTLAALRHAELEGAQLAVFPELALTGYPPEDLLASPSFVTQNQTALAALADKTTSCAAIVGFVDDRGGLRNAAAVAAGGRIVGVWHKELLPNYGVFDEQRWFAAGDGSTPLFRIGGVHVAVSICEDAWSHDGPVVRQGRAGAELVVSLNASPYRLGAVDERTEMLGARAKQIDAPIVYVNLVGGQDELVFDGASMVVDRTGKIVGSAPQFEEAIAVFDVPVEKKSTASQASTWVVSDAVQHRDDRLLACSPWVRGDEEVYGALVCATRSYVEKNGFSDVVIGLSGGIDSSLVALIATEALGPTRVHGVAMPSRYSADASKSDAKRLADNLGIDFREIGIEPVYSSFLDVLAGEFQGRAPDLTEENLQARVRGTLLMALSNKFDWLVLTTGNKSETAVGYSTMYGDSAGGFAVIKDVPKTLVYALCRLANARAGFDLVPESVLEKPPSAELRFDQRDDDTLPPYEVLDPILEGYVEQNLDVASLVAHGADADTARRVVDLVDHAEYKRRQAPIGPRVTSRGFGKDRRMPITNRFRASAEPLRLGEHG